MEGEDKASDEQLEDVPAVALAEAERPLLGTVVSCPPTGSRSDRLHGALHFRCHSIPVISLGAFTGRGAWCQMYSSTPSTRTCW